ncbi:MAG: hypothetical protein JWM77_3729 [Rhodospirillales bacterium]|jgi:arylformamidase|nr:hypothetical protein [Rhodospirillales bacterium]
MITEPGKTALPFNNLPKQPSVNPRADCYAAVVVRLSQLAALKTRCELDVVCGEGPANRLDIYMPDRTDLRDLPVFVNIHGGGWKIGFKEWMGLNAPAIVKFPAIYVSIEYGLSPVSLHPGSLRDCLQAVGWVYKNIAKYGGDPNRIHIGGHSAGGHLSSLLTLRRDLHSQFGIPANTIKSCFPYSGVYDLRDLRVYGQAAGANPGDMLLAKPEDAADASPITFVKGNKTPFFVTWSENDNVLVKAEGPAMVVALRTEAGRAEGYMFPRFDHFWIHVAQQDEANLWTRTLRAWMTGDPATAPLL